MSIHVPVTEEMESAVARVLLGADLGTPGPAMRRLAHEALAAAFKVAEIRMDPPAPSSRVTVYLDGPDGMEAITCLIGGSAIHHGAHVNSIQVVRANG